MKLPDKKLNYCHFLKQNYLCYNEILQKNIVMSYNFFFYYLFIDSIQEEFHEISYMREGEDGNENRK